MIGCFVVLVWLPVEYAYVHSCFNNYDLGIYGQAISLLSLNRPNPWLSTRDVFLFGDHFDPILFLAVPLRNVWHPSLVMIRVEMMSLLVAAAAPLWLCTKGLISRFIALFASAIILFSPLTLDAAYYPAHPGTWSLAPLSWLLAFLFASQWQGVWWAMIFTFLCKEEYPAATLFWGVILWIQGFRRQGFFITLVSALWCTAVFVVRPMILGSANMYADAVSSGSGLSLLSDGSGWESIAKRMVAVFGPAAFLWFVSGRSRAISRQVMTAILAFMAVMIMVRLLGGYWGNHRSAPLSIFAAFGVIAVARHYAPIGRWNILRVGIMAAALLLPGLELGTRLYRKRDFKRHCQSNPQRIADIMEAETLIRTRTDGPILAGGNLVPRLVDLPDVAQIGATKSTNFRYFLTETHSLRNPWPLSAEAYTRVEQAWRSSPESRVVLETPWVLLIRNEMYEPAGVAK
jgi:uncharacterized membrane protein